MTDFDSMNLVYLLGALVLVSSGLWGTRLSLGKWLQMALLWLGIFVLAWLIAANIEPIGRFLGLTAPVARPLNPHVA